MRPIAEFVFADYENLIAVKLRNVGTGPLLIEELYYCYYKDGKEEKFRVLYKELSFIGQMWSDYMEEVDGMTIPVGGEFVLMEFIPQNDEIKEMIRRKLSAITAHVKYKDVYGNVFKQKRLMSFFGRHFNKC